MKKILFLMASLLCSTDVFAASGLISGANQNKPVSFQIGRSGSLKMLPATKKSGTSVTLNPTSVMGARTSSVPTALSLGAITSFSKSRNSSLSKSSDKYDIQKGADGYPLQLKMSDDYVLYGWLIDTKNNMITMPEKIFDFNKIFDDEIQQDVTLTIRCNSYTRLFEYEIDDGGWESMPGSFCVVDDTDVETAEKNGRTPMVQCNKTTGLFEYRYADNERWVPMDSKCIADDGTAGGVPTFRCVAPGFMVYTYNQDPEFINNDKVSYWYHPGWELLVQSRCVVRDKYRLEGSLYIDCRDDNKGNKVYYVNNNPTDIVCVPEQDSQFFYDCEKNYRIVLDSWGQKTATDFSCNDDDCTTMQDSVYCRDGFVAYKTSCDGAREITNVHCSAFPHIYCDWRDKKVYYRDNNIGKLMNSGEACGNATIKCETNSKGKKQLSIAGSFINDNYCEDENLYGCKPYKVDNKTDYILILEKYGETGIMCPAPSTTPKAVECKPVDDKYYYYVCAKQYNGIWYHYHDTELYTNQEECQAECK